MTDEMGRKFSSPSDALMVYWENKQRDLMMTISLKGAQYPKGVILFAVFFYVRYAVLCRDPKDIMSERGFGVDHSTLNRWIIRYALQLADQAQARKRSMAR